MGSLVFIMEQVGKTRKSFFCGELFLEHLFFRHPVFASASLILSVLPAYERIRLHVSAICPWKFNCPRGTLLALTKHGAPIVSNDNRVKVCL